MPRIRGARRSIRSRSGGPHSAPGCHSRVSRTPGAGASSLTRATASFTVTTSSPAFLVVPSSPIASQLPGNVAVSQFLDMIRDEVRQQLGAQSGTTPSPASPLSPTSTSVVPVLPVAGSSTWSGMVLLLLCTGVCCHSGHGCVSAVCTGVWDHGCGRSCELGCGRSHEHGCVRLCTSGHCSGYSPCSLDGRYSGYRLGRIDGGGRICD